jgi:hypothetical protein
VRLAEFLAEHDIVVGDRVLYYAVDHSSSYLWNSATWENTQALLPFLRSVLVTPHRRHRRSACPREPWTIVIGRPNVTSWQIDAWTAGCSASWRPRLS